MRFRRSHPGATLAHLRQCQNTGRRPFLHTHPEEKNVVRLPRYCLWYYKPASQARSPGWKLMDLLRVFVDSPVLRAAPLGASRAAGGVPLERTGRG